MRKTRRDFLANLGAATAASFLDGCRLFDGASAGRGRSPSGPRGIAAPPAATRGVIVRVPDLSGAFDWPKLAHEAGLTTIATHIGPEEVLPFMKSDLGRRFVDGCEKYGIAYEHELHAMDYLLPRERFAREPELFRMNEKGEREQKNNCCVSNPRALEIVAERAVEVARVCRSSSGRYFYWFSDVAKDGLCCCPKCRGLCGADQALMVENAIVKALRAEIDPRATLSHLAYLMTAETPKVVTPDPALFLEYAPFRRWHRTVRRDDLVEGGPYLSRLDELLKVFPVETAQVCEYWLDESLFCGWKKPLVKIPWNTARTRADLAAYAKRGLRHFTTFAVSIDDDYVADFGTDSLGCVSEYARLLKEAVKGRGHAI